jgi:hypothetical protein
MCGSERVRSSACLSVPKCAKVAELRIFFFAYFFSNIAPFEELICKPSPYISQDHVENSVQMD